MSLIVYNQVSIKKKENFPLFHQYTGISLDRIEEVDLNCERESI